MARTSDTRGPLRRLCGDVAHGARKLVLRARRAARIDAYLRDHRVRKLQIGAGANDLAGWLNADNQPRNLSQIFVDASRRLPFPDGSIDYIFSEHMIEHLDHDQGLSLLRDCRRIARCGASIRIATPDIANLVGLYAPSRSAEQNRYLQWALGYNGLPRMPGAPCFVLNHFVRGWGHRFVYDFPTLQSTLEAAGWDDVRRCAPGESDDTQLRGLESHGRAIGHDNNLFETMVAEARRVP